MRGFGIALSCLLVSASVSEASTLRLLLESDPETGIGDVFLSSFDTFDDLVNSPAGGGPGGFSGLKISPGFSVGGLAYDGKYRLLLESDPETGFGDVFLASFDTFDDLVNSPAGGGAGEFSGLKISPGFSVGGLAYEFDPPAVPLPASAYLLLGALGLAGALRRRA